MRDGRHRGAVNVVALKPPYPADHVVFNRENGEQFVVSLADAIKIRAISLPDGTASHFIMLHDQESE